MVRSEFCALSQHSSHEMPSLGECSYDQGGYFIVNGNEKVMIAQERMSTNHVYVFSRKPPSKYSYTAGALFRSLVPHSFP